VSSLAEWPVTRPLFFLLAFWVLVLAGETDRSFLLDQDSYVTYFVAARDLPWLLQRADQEPLLQFLITQAFSEEVLWGVWTYVLAAIVDPVTAVQVTVYLLNTLIIVATWRTAKPEFALLLWILMPTGFAVTGLIQIRQGLALSVMLYLALGLRRPAFAAAVAAMFHTTFAIAFVFAFVGRVFRARERFALAVTVFAAFAGAYLGSVLFEMFGGRRLMTYRVEDGATSINYVFVGLLAISPSAYWIFRDRRPDEDQRGAALVSQLALMHIGATAFTLFSFFLFPLGASRVGYLTQLLLIPILPAVAGRRGVVPKAIVGLLLVYLLYLVGKSYFEGTYALYFGP
jgi:hypothetical protein